MSAVASFEELRRAIEAGDASSAKALTIAMVEQGSAPAQILSGALLPGMAEVGVRFRSCDIFLPDVLLAARAMKASMGILEPLLLRDRVPNAGVIVLGTVRGDLHDIGKNLVSVMLQGAGYRVVDLGTDVDPEKFVDAAVESQASLIGLSALLTTTMTDMGTVIRRVEGRGMRERLRVMVGGAPVTESFAREIGADGWAPDAMSAVERVRSLLAS